MSLFTASEAMFSRYGLFVVPSLLAAVALVGCRKEAAPNGEGDAPIGYDSNEADYDGDGFETDAAGDGADGVTGASGDQNW